MRVLWFSNIPLAPLLGHWGHKINGTGFWMHALIAPLKQSSEISRIGVVYAGMGCRDEHVELDGVDYYVVKQSFMAQRIGIGSRRDENRCLKAFVDIIENFRPDIIHIHGTERFYGRLKVNRITDRPTLVSIQGIMNEYARHAWGEKAFTEMLPLTNLWEIIHLLPTLRIKSSFLRRAQVENQILSAVDGIIGRTDWDRSYCRMLVPDKPYYHVDEMLRPEFSSMQWSSANATRHQVYTTGRLTFLKGMHVFLDAMTILRRDYPNLKVRIAGADSSSPESQFMMHQVQQLGLTDTIQFLGWIPASQIVEELITAHCYVNTSFIENSSNSIQEALLVGTPCVAAFTGGTSTLIKHERTGLLVSNGCAHMFADAIRELFENDSLCESLSNAAREAAIVRNDPKRILAQLIAAYSATCQQSAGSGAPIL